MNNATIHVRGYLSERKANILSSLRRAVTSCGYDYDEILTKKTRERYYADARSIIWKVYQGATDYTPAQIGRDFGWNRSTVSCALNRADALLMYNIDFSELYDAIRGAFDMAMSEAVTNQNN